MSMLGGAGNSVRVEDVVDAETWFYHASVNLDHGFGGQHDVMYIAKITI